VLIDRYQNIWITTLNKGLLLWKKDGNILINYSHSETNRNSISDNNARTIYEDSSGMLWIGTKNGLDLFTNAGAGPHSAIFLHFRNNSSNMASISEGTVLSIAEDNKHNLWVGTENGGLNVLNLSNKKNIPNNFRHFKNIPGQETSISNNSIYSLSPDRQGNLWIGTFGNGISILYSIAEKFQVYKSNPYRNSVSNDHVNTFCQDDNYIWIGTEDGLNRFDPRTNIFEVFKHQPSNPSSISSNAIWSILKDRKGNLWIGTWAGGLNKFNYRNQTFSKYYALQNGLSSNNIFALTEGDSGNIWIGTLGGGLNKFNPVTNTFIIYNNSNSCINGDYIEAIVKSKTGDLWFENSNPSGQFLVHFEISNSHFELYANNQHDSNSLSSAKINAIFEDSRNNLWIGTDDGLNRFDRNTKIFSCFRQDDGLPDNSIRSILEDNHGNLWLGTNKGLSKFIHAVNLPQVPIFKNYTVDDGLQGNEFISRSCLKDKKGKLYFGGINGFNAFYPDSISENHYIPDIVITDFYLYNQLVSIGKEDSPLKQSITTSKEIIINHKQTVFTFKFAALSYIIPEKNQYMYMMEGFDKHWNNVGNKREATYTNLNPGSYIFHVKGSNNDGVWNETGVSLRIKILPPLWKTVWFKIALILFTISALFGFMLIRFNVLRKQKAYLEALVIERTSEIEEKNRTLIDQTEELKATNEKLNILNATKDKFFSIIAHDLKNPFGSLMGFLELLVQNYNKYDETKRITFINLIFTSSKSIYKLLENLLQWARSQTSTIEFQPVDFYLNDVINSNILLVENMLNEKGLSVKVDMPVNMRVFGDKNMINTVFRNILANAIKFSENSQITVSTIQSDGYAQINITDSGIGMDANQMENIFSIGGSKSDIGTRGETGTGLGLILCKEFIEKNNGTIVVESEKGIGTSFSFTIPLIKPTLA
jgi:signal transduction histidine kinase/ligand-binding sensor domain-containing protein